MRVAADVLTDPKPGDVVARPTKNPAKRSIREVLRRDGFNVIYQHRSEIRGVIQLPSRKSESCWITTWRDWTRKAEVHDVAS